MPDFADNCDLNFQHRISTLIRASFVLLVFLLNGIYAHSQSVYNHNLFWGRVALSDKLSDKLKWEVYLQTRTQNDPAEKLSLFQHQQTTNYWLWLHYQVTKETRISVTPFCYFNIRSLFPQPASLGNRGVNEYRWAAQLEQTTKLKHLLYSNRYSLEYRLRDLQTEKVFVPNFRVRYRAKLEYPIPKEGHPASLILYDEVFLEFGKIVNNSAATFNQNRLYAGFSYEVMKSIKFNLGYMYLTQERASGSEFDNSNVIWTILTFENVFSQFKKKEIELK